MDANEIAHMDANEIAREIAALDFELAHSTIYSDQYVQAHTRRTTIGGARMAARTPDDAAHAHTVLSNLLLQRKVGALLDAMDNGTTEQVRIARDELRRTMGR